MWFVPRSSLPGHLNSFWRDRALRPHLGARGQELRYINGMTPSNISPMTCWLRSVDARACASVPELDGTGPLWEAQNLEGRRLSWSHWRAELRNRC